SVYGKVCIGSSIEERRDKFMKGDSLVSEYTVKDIVEVMKDAKAIIVESGGLTSHASIVGLSFGIPTIVSAKDATEIVQDGDIVTGDAGTGVVYQGEAKVL